MPALFHNDLDVEGLGFEGGEVGRVAGDEAELTVFEEGSGPVDIVVVEGEANKEVGGVEDVEGFAMDLLVNAKNGEGEVERFQA